MTVSEFTTKYELDSNHVHVAINYGSIPPTVKRGVKNGLQEIDEDWFLRRRAFKKRVTQYNQDMYFLVSTILPDQVISKMIGIAHPFIASDMFRLDDSSIMKVRVNDNHWKTFRFFRRVQIAIKRRFGISFDIAKILDAEAGIIKETDTEYFSIRDASSKVRKYLEENRPNGTQRKRISNNSTSEGLSSSRAISA